jgi:hypothetical protein
MQGHSSQTKNPTSPLHNPVKYLHTVSPLRRPLLHRRLLILFPPVPQIPRFLLQLRMLRLRLDQDELLRALPRSLLRDVRELLGKIFCLGEGPVEGLVGRVWQPLQCEDA